MTADDPEQGAAALSEAHTTVWEWIVAAAAALVVGATIAFTLYKALTRPETPPQVVIEDVDVHRGAGGYIVMFWARNVGGTTAQGLTIEGQLVADTGVIATRSASISFIPSESRRRAGIVFPIDPRPYELRIYPVGFDVP